MTHEPEVADLDDSPFSDFLGFELLLELDDGSMVNASRTILAARSPYAGASRDALGFGGGLGGLVDALLECSERLNIHNTP